MEHVAFRLHDKMLSLGNFAIFLLETILLFRRINNLLDLETFKRHSHFKILWFRFASMIEVIAWRGT